MRNEPVEINLLHMKNNFIAPHNLPQISSFLSRREACIDILINSLTIVDVEDEFMYQKTNQRIRSEILVEPVEMGDIEYVEYELQVNKSKTKQAEEKKNDKFYIHQVIVPYTGNKAIFCYSPDEAYSQIDPSQVSIIPLTKCLVINIGLTELNPDLAIAEAKAMMNLTIQFIEKNNATVLKWNVAAEQNIESKLRQKRSQLIAQQKSQSYKIRSSLDNQLLNHG